MDLTGQLTSPDVKFDIELPNERDEVQAIVRNYIPTDEQMNMQILYLLAIGKFYTPENLGATQNSNMMSSVVSSTLSGQLNNASITGTSAPISVPVKEAGQTWSSRPCFRGNY